jgi:hypothetical protein
MLCNVVYISRPAAVVRGEVPKPEAALGGAISGTRLAKSLTSQRAPEIAHALVLDVVIGFAAQEPPWEPSRSKSLSLNFPPESPTAPLCPNAVTPTIFSRLPEQLFSYARRAPVVDRRSALFPPP